MSAFPDCRDRKGEFKVPQNCLIGMGNDWGSSGDAHKNAMLWFFVMKKGSVTTNGIDLSGSVFMFHEHKQAAHSTVRQASNSIKKYESSVGIRPEMVYERLMSHEAASERDTYIQEHGLDFRAWSTDFNAGIAQVKDYMELHSFHQPHPFREISREKNNPDKPKIMGRPRLFIIVEDTQGGLQFDETMGRWTINAPVDEWGAMNLRQEIPTYHFNQQAADKPTHRLRPAKMLDDFVDVLRCLAATFFPPIAPLTQYERLEKDMPEELKITNILKETPEEMSRSYIARYEYEDKIIQKHKNTGRNWRERVYDKAAQQDGF